MGNWVCDIHHTYMSERSVPCPYCEITRLSAELEQAKIVAEGRLAQLDAISKENEIIRSTRNETCETIEQLIADLAIANKALELACYQLDANKPMIPLLQAERIEYFLAQAKREVDDE